MILQDLSLVRFENLRATKQVNKPELIHDSGFVRVYEVKNSDSKDYYIVKDTTATHVVSHGVEWLAKDDRYTQICTEMNDRALKDLPGKSSNLRFKVLTVIGNAYSKAL